MQVSHDEGVAIHIGPESCAVARESGGISICFVDFAAVLFDSGRLRCVSIRLFLVRNWSGGMHRYCSASAHPSVCDSTWIDGPPTHLLMSQFW